MPTPLEFTYSCLWELFYMHRKVRERHDLIVTAMVKENRECFEELCSPHFIQCKLINLPTPSSPVRRGDQENACQRFFEPLFRKVFQQDGTAYGMPNQGYLDLAIQRG